MQIKSIRRNIQNKMNEWLATITDEKLRTSVKNNLIVTGGCITSLFLKEDVNDYDIYINRRDILLKLVEYYTRIYTGIRILDGAYKQDLIDEVDKRTGIFAISVKNLAEDQIKIFIEDKNGGMLINENLNNEDAKYLPIFFSPNAITLNNNIQIIIRFHGEPEEVHKNFDFVHATNYFTFKEGLVTNKEALESILTKQLKYAGSLYPLTSILRMKKFVKRNWNINAGEVLKIMFQISELNLKDINILEEQLIGIDVAFFSSLIAILRNVDPNTLTNQYINSIIDKVFDESEESGI